jgi:hypothetical protein
MIIRQSDQIQFLLTRIIELENKIKKLNSTDVIEEEDIIEEEEIIKEEDIIKEEENCKPVENLEEPQSSEKDFELVEPSSTYKISKNNGWLRFIF